SKNLDHKKSIIVSLRSKVVNHYRDQEYSQAQDLWIEAYSLDSTNTRLLDWIENVKNKRMRTSSYSIFENLKHENPSISLLINKGIVFYLDREYFEARNLWLEAYKLDSTNTELLDWIKTVNKRKLKLTKKTHYSSSSKLKHQNPIVDSLMNKGIKHYRDQEYPQAQDSWIEAYSLDSTNTVLLDWITNVQGFRIRATNNPHSEDQN
ncbi:MAG: hypothetical protein OCD01_20515, partial [Fibrobacterales bacterium]